MEETSVGSAESGVCCGFFAGPMALLLVANIAFLSLTVRNICQSAAVSDMASTGQALSKKRFLILSSKLFTIMGLTWAFGFLANLTPDSSVLWYLFAIFGSLQGVFICLGFVCRKRVYHMLKTRLNFGYKQETVPELNTGATTYSGIMRTEQGTPGE